jgi:pimeloyl-ACP methyl ester carboxylesterase
MIVAPARIAASIAIDTPVILLSGESSPKHLGERIDALEHTMPHAEKVVLAKHGHNANQKAPDKLAALIETFYDTLLAS